MLTWVHEDFGTIYIQSQVNKQRLPYYTWQCTSCQLIPKTIEVKVSIVGNNLAAHAGEMLIGCYFSEKSSSNLHLRKFHYTTKSIILL